MYIKSKELINVISKYIKSALSMRLAALFFAVIICVALVISLFNLPVSAKQKEEQDMKEKISSEFVDVENVELRQEYNGLFSEYKGFEVYNKKGENIGFVTKDAVTGDINSILYQDHEHTPGEPRISKDKAQAIASPLSNF